MMTSSIDPGKQPRMVNRVDGENLVRILDTIRTILLAIFILFFLFGSAVRPAFRQDGAYTGVNDGVDDAAGHLFGVGDDNRSKAAVMVSWNSLKLHGNKRCW